MSAQDAPATLSERKRREALEELVETSIELFERDGFEATTVEAIAAEAGASPRTFYRYFGSKEDVLFEYVPEMTDRLCAALERRLGEGAHVWDAATEAVVEILGRFDADHESIPVRRMKLWLAEPALRARYMLHLSSTERALVETLARHRGTDPDRDDLAHLVAIGVIGAYRTTVTTHGADSSARLLTKHLRELMGQFGEGLGAVAQRS